MNEQAATASETCATEEHWAEFGIAARLAVGEEGYRRGDAWVDWLPPGHRLPDRGRNWRLGWLWGCYEDLNPRMRRDGQFEWHRYARKSLAFKVLCVASLNLPLGRWRCYIDAVPGQDHDDEWLGVSRWGVKLPQRVAEELFPELARHFLWED